MNHSAIIAKALVSVICIFSLVFLYVFGERFFQTEIQIESQEQADNGEQDSFMFDPEELVYDGTGDLDLLEGVSLENFSQEELKNKVFIKISPADNLSRKTIEYTADTKKGRIRSNRSLRLVNYNGPKIELPDEMPSVAMDEVDKIMDLLSEDESYKAEDGFGKDAREHVQVNIEKSVINSAEVQYTFVLENVFGDRTMEKANVFISDVPAVITLTEKEVFLQAGDSFDPTEYIEKAVDSAGESIIEEVVFSSDFNTARSGEYLVTYDLRGQTVSLTVVVE